MDMLDQLLGLLKEVEKNDEYFEVSARIMKKMYNSLIAEGFTSEQAIRIVSSQGISLSGS